MPDPPEPDEEVKEWIPVVARPDGTLRRQRDGKQHLLVGWRGVGPNGEIRRPLAVADPGELVPRRTIPIHLHRAMDERRTPSEGGGSLALGGLSPLRPR
jgi:hypothetical protein